MSKKRESAEGAARAGTQALSLLASPINVRVLHALVSEPRALPDLRLATGSPPVTTMRGYLRSLEAAGVLERRRQSGFPGRLDFALTAAGRGLVKVTEALGRWLALAPDGPLPPDTPTAQSAIKALLEAWETNVMRALAAKPLALTELDSLIADVSYPSLERRLTSMRQAGQVEKVRGSGRARPYAVTDWLRHAVAPLAAAFSWERRHLPERGAPATRLDVEAGFLLAVPLLRLSTEVSGRCRMVVELSGDRGMAGVVVEVRKGHVTSCVSRLRGQTDAWASGSPLTWLAALADRDSHRLELNGDCELAKALVEGLHGALYGPRAPLVSPRRG